MARDITTDTPIVAALDYLLGIKDGLVGRLPGAALGGEGSFGEWWLGRLGTDPAAAIQTLLDAANAAAARAALGIVNGVEGIETSPAASPSAPPISCIWR